VRRVIAHADTACVIVLIMAVAATVVSANATLVSATPADGAAVTAPSRLVLRFNGRVDTKGSTIVLAGGPRRTRVLLVTPDASAEPDVLAFKLPALEAGRYRVEWTGLSVGGQPVVGGVSFEVVSPAAPSR
jgi:methionine-rich copper-binding protein CopC